MFKTNGSRYAVILGLFVCIQFLAAYFSSSHPFRMFWILLSGTAFMVIIITIWSLSTKLKQDQFYTGTLLDSLDDMILICNEKGEFVYSNRLFENILHRPPNHDDLTSLLNRRGFHELAARCLDSLRELQQPAAMFYFDLDGFKNVNDIFGHQAGDALLQQLASRLAAVINQDDLSSRQGGDEFALLVKNLNEDGAKRKAVEIHNLFQRPFHVEGQELTITTSIGVSRYPADGEHIERFLKNADRAMYFSKIRGKNQISFFHEMQPQA